MEKRVDRNRKIYEETKEKINQKNKQVSNEEFKHTHSILEGIDERYFKEGNTSISIENENVIDDEKIKKTIDKKQYIITAIIFAIIVLLIITIAVVISL